MSSETDLSRNQAIQNQRNSFSRGFPLPLNVETLQAFGALFQIPQYYRKCLYYKTKMFKIIVIYLTSSCVILAFFGMSGLKPGPRVPKKPKLHKNELNTTFFCSTSPLKAPNH
jgi:hypothetical protein